MNFSLTEDQLAIREMAREFAEKEVAVRAAAIDKESAFPQDLFDLMVRMGFTGLCVPEKYGGSGGNQLDKVIVVEEIAKKCAATAAVLSIHMLFAFLLLKFGSEEQKKKYLPEVTSGGCLAAFALTEPGAGSDAGSARTTAILDEASGEYVINGTKCFISGGGRAKYVALIALTQPEKGLKGFSCILVERGTPGFSVGKTEEKMGLHGSETVELIFENCRVPRENLLGEEGKGFKYAMIGLDAARIGIAAQALGIAEGALEEAVKYMHQRVQFGKPIAELQGLQWYIADMATKMEAAKWLTYYAAYLESAGLPHTKEAAMAKLNASENARFVTNLALQIHGGYGYMKDYPLERMYRDAKITEIYEGTSEIHKVVISRAVLG
ncbi:acryloyl-CoA reductase [Papillibacter cinnamivorans]|uniref:Acyl-CoA dehydrogenase n=1 Tax=Papillibacter cinnamivorans DSM 12816 TaxID=1122930 RepID=A0A1W2CKJ0_9FIRM|nr:acryloyl-CoA reductase [Papillibacter cinnamivorans]SMC85710.1 Acyl-CoA dehydrogenase [Papillibacter cinnamivorans DSM 12816]